MKVLTLLIILSTSFAFHSPMKHQVIDKNNSLWSSNAHTETKIKSATSSSSDIITKPSYKAILFDIDGTLADSWKLGYDATAAILQKHNIQPITQEIYHDCTRYCTPERLARHAGLHPINDKIEFEEVGDKLAKEFDEMYVNLVSKSTAGFYPGIHDMLQSIKPRKVGALTNACVAYAHAVLNANSINDIFISVHGADSVPKPKPNPDGLLHCCMEMNVDPSHCVYIGDSPSDALAAQAAGMPSIGVAWGSHSVESIKKAPFMHICSNVDELKQLIMS